MIVKVKSLKRSIGIDINKGKISIVQLCFSGGKFSLERVSIRKMPEINSFEEKAIVDVKSLINSMLAEDNFDISAKVTVTAPSDRIFFQHFRTDLSVNEEVKLSCEIADDVGEKVSQANVTVEIIIPDDTPQDQSDNPRETIQLIESQITIGLYESQEPFTNTSHFILP